MTASSRSSHHSVATAAETSPVPAAPAVFCLEVRRGSTKYPERPFPIGRYLIGAGEQCDLRLGGAGMPPIHSILLVDAESAVVETIVAAPSLRINGQVRQSSSLKFGDVMAIGGVEFVAKSPAASGNIEATLRPDTGSNVAHNNSDRADELALKSAVELVELIEAEVHRIEDFQTRRELGAEALLQAALRRAETEEEFDDVSTEFDLYSEIEPDAAQLSSVEMPMPVTPVGGSIPTSREPAAGEREIEEIIARLDGFSEQLERRSQRLEEHEAEYLEASTELLRAQQRLADHLQHVQQQIESLEAPQPNTLRASA